MESKLENIQWTIYTWETSEMRTVIHLPKEEQGQLKYWQQTQPKDAGEQMDLQDSWKLKKRTTVFCFRELSSSAEK